MAGTAVFQSGTIATPGPGIVVATDPIGGTQWQQIKIDVGPAGTSIALSYGGTGMPLGTLPGTVSALGTFQPLAGSVHLASGTVSVLGTVQAAGTSQVIGTVQTHGTSQALGTVQLVGAVPVGTIAGTISVGTVAGTVQVLGTTQPLAGSVHLASNLAGGTVVAVGSAAHDAAADARPILVGAFGSSGTQAAVNDGDAVRLWADLNGRLQIRGTIDQMPAITVSSGTIPGGTVTTQPLVTGAGTYVAARLTDGASYYTATGGAVNVADQTAFSAGVSAGAPMMGISTVTAIGQGSIGLLAMGSDRVALVRPYGGTLDGGTFQAFGTTQVIGTVQTVGTRQVLGTVAIVETEGTSQIQGFIGKGTLAAGNPLTIGAVGSSGTIAAVADGSTQYLWTDLSGRLQVRGTIDSIPAIVITSGTVSLQTGGTIHVGSVQSVAGTVQVLGTTQPLAGSVHLASNIAGGTIVVVGSAAHGATADARPVLNGAFGSSGTQAAVADGQATRLWADLNGRLQVRGTIDSIPNITITAGTVSLNTGGTIHVGSVQRIAGTVQTQGFIGKGTLAAGNPLLLAAVGSSGTIAAVADGSTQYLWADVSGRLQVRGTIDSMPNVTITAGTVSLNTGGTIHVGSVQSVAGTVQVLGSVQAVGTVNVGTVQGTVQVRPAGVAGEGFVGTIYSGAAFSTVAVLVNPASGTFVRLFDIIVSGSAAGTARLEFGSAAGTLISTIFSGDNGGLSFQSSRGIRSPGTSKGVYFTASAGSWGVMINYALEN